MIVKMRMNAVITLMHAQTMPVVATLTVDTSVNVLEGLMATIVAISMSVLVKVIIALQMHRVPTMMDRLNAHVRMDLVATE